MLQHRKEKVVIQDTFPEHQRYCILDTETYSELDITEVGAYEYSVHPSTEILCLSFTIGTKKELKEGTSVHTWVPDIPSSALALILKALLDPTIILVAHNAFFDHMIVRNTFVNRYMSSYKDRIQAVPFERWLCTAALSSAQALPRSLENVVDACRLPMKKNMDGRKLVLKYCKPRRPSSKDPRTRWDDKEELQKIYDYCEDDIRATVGVLLHLNPLSPVERKLWCLDQKINFRGFLVDRPLVLKVLGMIDEEVTVINREVETLSMGLIQTANQVAKIKLYLEDEGLSLPGLGADIVMEALESGLAEGDAKRMLELRQAGSLSSTAKYPQFKQRTLSDNRLRDNLVFHGATTGRWTGSGFQPQNMPRPLLGYGTATDHTIGDTITAARVIAEGDLETVRMVYGDPMKVFASCVRSMIISPAGKVIDVADYNAIEVRVAFWLAGDMKGVEAYRQNQDLYRHQASSVFNIPADKIGKDSFERFVGKELVLGCQYGMGWKKFKESCRKKGQDIADALAEKAIKIYRRDRPEVVKAWNNLESAAISAVHNPGKTFFTNRTEWFMIGKHLYCTLPSGRRLCYPFARIKSKVNKFGHPQENLYYHTQDALTRKWVEVSTWGGTLMNHITQGTARDIMGAAMLRIEDTRKWETILTVHDEILSERDVFNGATNSEFVKLMEVLPVWAEGCPIKVAGFETTRYKK